MGTPIVLTMVTKLSISCDPQTLSDLGAGFHQLPIAPRHGHWQVETLL